MTPRSAPFAFALAVGAACVATAAAPAHAQSALDRARDELGRGYALRKEGKYAQALPILLDSYRLEPLLKTLINVADCEEHLGKLASARAHWTDAGAEATKLGDAAIAGEARKRLDALETRTPAVTLRLAADAPERTEVTWDGASVAALGSPMRVDPGPHQAVVRAPGRPARSFDVTLAEGDRRAIELAPAPAAGAGSAMGATTDGATPPPSGSSRSSAMRTVGWLGVGVGAASAVVGAAFGLEAMAKKSEASCPSNACGHGGDADALRAAVRDGNRSTAFFVVGGMLAAAGVTLLVLAPPPAAPSPSAALGAAATDGASPRATVVLAPTGVSLQGAW